MTPPIDEESSISPATLSKVLAGLSIIVILLSGAFWVFSANATAQRADEKASSALTKLENKADKQETQDQLKRIYDKLDSIDSYLRDLHK